MTVPASCSAVPVVSSVFAGPSSSSDSFTTRLSPPSSPPFSRRSSEGSVSSAKSRPASVYTLTRPSLAEKVAELAALPQPDRPSLAEAIAAFPTARAAAEALFRSAEQITRWIDRAGAVLHSLDADGDVSWATASGREGLEEVDSQISRFSGMVSLFVAAVEELQNRSDVGVLDGSSLTILVDRVEAVVGRWSTVKASLVTLKAQVEIALEWEELWDSVVGEIAFEITALRRLIFQMEERRHHATLSAYADGGQAIDLGELETIVEEAPARKRARRPRSDDEEVGPGGYSHPEDGNLMSLFARMQPLRASLDFLPMRLSNFLTRGRRFFAADCDDLECRRRELEKDWKMLQANAESLRRELGEDQWVLVFRNAGRQAMKMCDSVARTVGKLRDGLDDEVGQNAMSAGTSKKMESYEAKKIHYGAAIERVLSIIDRGVKDRLTVNGEILRLQADMRRRWSELQEEIRAVDFVLERLGLADSRLVAAAMAVTPLSRIPAAGGSAYSTPAIAKPDFVAPKQPTPASSPASSIVLPQAMSRGTKSRQNSFNSTSAATTTSSMSVRRPSHNLAIGRNQTNSTGIGLTRKPSRLGSTTTEAKRLSTSSKGTPTTPKSSSRPPWALATNTTDLVVGHVKLGGYPTSPSAAALGRKKSQLLARAASGASGAAVPMLGLTPMSNPNPNLPSSPGSPTVTPRPSAVFVPPTILSPPSSGLIRSTLPRPTAGSRPASSLANSRPGLMTPRTSMGARTGLPTPTMTAARPTPAGNDVSGPRSRSSMALIPPPSASRLSGASSSLGSRPVPHGSFLPAPTPSRVVSRQGPSPQVNQTVHRMRSSLPAPSMKPLQAPPLSRSAYGRASPMPPARPPSSMQRPPSVMHSGAVRSSPAAAGSAIPMAGGRGMRRQSSAARLVTSPPPVPATVSRLPATMRPKQVVGATPAKARPHSVMVRPTGAIPVSSAGKSLLPQPSRAGLMSPPRPLGSAIPAPSASTAGATARRPRWG